MQIVPNSSSYKLENLIRTSMTLRSTRLPFHYYIHIPLFNGPIHPNYNRQITIALPNSHIADRKLGYMDITMHILHTASVPPKPAGDQLDNQRQAINPLTPSQIIFLNTVTNVQQPGVQMSRNMFNLPGNQTPRITAQNLRELDWTQIDRRIEDGWWHLYPFGERYFDRELSRRPWMDKQIDLDFFFPYYGFRFNYTFIFQEGFIAFSHPWYIQPPYTYPNPHWPKQPDPTLIAAFMAEQRIQYVGDTRISNVWFRIVERPPSLIGYNNLYLDTFASQQRHEPQGQPQGVYSYDNPRYYRTYRGRQLKTQEGRIEDPEFLDQITNDIRHGMVGARGWKADYGSPKVTDLSEYERAKRWQNTYQLVIATDEIRSYCMFNFGNINWTSSATAGAITGGRAEGNSYKLVQYGSTQIAGRWLARIDEQIQYGGCSNESRGTLETSQQYGNMLGGFALNVSYRITDIIKLQFDEITIDCERIDMVIARCVIPVNSVFKTGLVEVKLSVDGGKNYPWWTKFYICTIMRQIPRPGDGITAVCESVILGSTIEAMGISYCNSKIMSHFSCCSMYWSSPVSFGWFFVRKWEYEYGRNWAFELCQHWYDYDGRRENFVMDLEPKVPCPCSLDQAVLDIGRFTALPDCDAEGDHRCYYTQGAKHCVISTFSVWTGAAQVCCYDFEGWLMFSDDFEYNNQYLRFYSAGVPYRAHPWGAFPYKRPPYVPTMSNFYNDLLPYDFCCKWAAYVYGASHITTFDGVRYSFNGKGYYILTMMKSPRHDLMIQGRLEQPPPTIFNHLLYKYLLERISVDGDIRPIVDGVRIYFDMPWKKIQTFQGVTLRNPPRNMNQSEIDIMFTTGVGIRVQESRGCFPFHSKYFT
ncbi:AMOP domain-containing protein [Ditylenchus destructor]|nr:AMOP domain-containing protein [Ditylenchus destructor]